MSINIIFWLVVGNVRKHDVMKLNHNVYCDFSVSAIMMMRGEIFECSQTINFIFIGISNGDF